MFVRQTSTSHNCFLMLHCFPSLHSAYLLLVSFQTAKCVLPCTATALLTVSSLKDIHLSRRLAPMSSELYWNMQPDFAPFVNSSPSIISPVCLHCEHLAPPRSNSWLLHTLAVVSYLLNSECHNFHLLNSVCMYTRYGGLYPFLNPGSNDLFLNLDYSPYKHRLCLLTLVSWLPPTFSANLSSPSQPPSSRHPQSSTWEKQLHYLLFFRAVGKIYLYFLCFPPCLLVTLTVDICG